MTSHKPEASWRKEFNEYSPELSTLLSEDVSRAIKSFIERAVEEEISAERKRIDEAIREYAKLTPNGETISDILSIIHKKN